MAKLRVREELRATANEQIQLARWQWSQGKEIDPELNPDMKMIEGCALEVLEEAADSSWAEVEVICSRGSLEVSKKGYVVSQA